MRRVPTNNKKLISWVKKMAEMCQPDNLVWVDGSQGQKEQLEKEAFQTKELFQLDQSKLPGCVLHRTAINDVARTDVSP
jgi:phosphoenolpyruvate carboxykinase (GTP)